jgi:hypothetical protein
MKSASLLATIAGLCAVASVAHAQVVINEVYLNPPGGGTTDDRWEYIEIYGPPGMSLTGWAVAQVMGGMDADGNDVPGPGIGGGDNGDETPEIDEAFSLDGLTIGANGLLCVFNDVSNDLQLAQFNPATARRSFALSNIPSIDVAGRLRNDGSATYMLVRRRPAHALNASGQSLYGGSTTPTYPGNPYTFRKDVNQDVDFDGRLDFGGIATLIDLNIPFPAETPVDSERGGAPATPPASIMEPIQVVDDIAWSNEGGKEYTRSTQQEISETPGFNPDAVSRVFYFGSNPERGHIFTGTEMISTRMADEEFIYGDIPSVTTNDYAPSTSLAPAKGPTDPNGPTYNASGALDPSGEFLLNDININGFNVTPGNFNDVNSSASGGANIVQFRFVRGDFNFDGVVDCADKALIEQASSEGWTLDDAATIVRRNNTPETSDDISYAGWRFEGREFNGLLAMIRMSLTDGSTGEWTSGQVVQAGQIVGWGGAVTAVDLSTFNTEFATLECAAPCPACPADFDQDGGVTGADVEAFFLAFESGDPCGDTDLDGGVTGADVEAFFIAFENGGC